MHTAAKTLLTPFLPVSLVLCVLGVSAPAAQALELGLRGGLDYANDVDSSGDSDDVKPGAVFGIAANVGLLPELSLEVDALHATTRIGNSNALLGEYTRTTHAWEFPILLRYWFIPVASFGLGPYLAFAQGDIETTDSAGQTTHTDIEKAGFKKTDVGAVASFEVSIPVMPILSLVGDLRYLRGIANLYDGPADTSVRHHAFEILIGASYTLF